MWGLAGSWAIAAAAVSHVSRSQDRVLVCIWNACLSLLALTRARIESLAPCEPGAQTRHRWRCSDPQTRIDVRRDTPEGAPVRPSAAPTLRDVSGSGRPL